MKSLLHTAASLLLKVKYDGDSKENVIGFCTDFNYTVTQGQKLIYTVDMVTPVEIAQGAGPSQVRGSMTLFLPKGVTLEAAGLVPYRQDERGNDSMALSKTLTFKIYDRSSSALVASIENCKVGQYSVSITARGIVRCQLTFDGTAVTPGNAL